MFRLVNRKQKHTKMKKQLKNALRYIQENHSWSDTQEKLANERIGVFRIPMSFADPSITDEIEDLLEEYGDDHYLQEGWWRSFGDSDDIYEMLCAETTDFN